MKIRLIACCLIVLNSASVFAAEYYCDVLVKRDLEHIYSEQEHKKWQWGVKIVDDGASSTISRCSFSTSENRVTCDDYPVEYMHADPYVGIKKYYYFTGHFDVQLYPDMQFIENNGRGSIGRGQCKLTRP